MEVELDGYDAHVGKLFEIVHVHSYDSHGARPWLSSEDGYIIVPGKLMMSPEELTGKTLRFTEVNESTGRAKVEFVNRDAPIELRIQVATRKHMLPANVSELMLHFAKKAEYVKDVEEILKNEFGGKKSP